MAGNPRACATCAKVEKTIMPASADAPEQVFYNCHANPPYAGRLFPDVAPSDWCRQHQAASTLDPIMVTIRV